MKLNLKKLLCILLVNLIFVTMLPATLFANESAVSVGTSFVIDGITYYLMPDSIVEHNGETFVGVFRRTMQNDWSNATTSMCLSVDGDRAAGGKICYCAERFN